MPSTLTDERELRSAIQAYYTNYYRDQLGLPNWVQKVETRLDEENYYAKRVLDWIESWINYSFASKRVLVVGGGTGAEVFALQARGADVAAIEPDTDAVRILTAKARVQFKVSNPGVQAAGEALPFGDNHFDFVYCYTVLEHTQDPLRCIDEMLRVVRPGGWLFIETPDYRFPYEGHYKITFPPFVPKFLGRLYLWLRGRPPRFLSSISYVNAHQLRTHLQNRNVVTLQIYFPIPEGLRNSASFHMKLRLFFVEKLGIQRDVVLLAKTR